MIPAWSSLMASRYSYSGGWDHALTHMELGTVPCVLLLKGGSYSCHFDRHYPHSISGYYRQIEREKEIGKWFLHLLIPSRFSCFLYLFLYFSFKKLIPFLFWIYESCLFVYTCSNAFQSLQKPKQGTRCSRTGSASGVRFHVGAENQTQMRTRRGLKHWVISLASLLFSVPCTWKVFKGPHRLLFVSLLSPSSDIATPIQITLNIYSAEVLFNCETTNRCNAVYIIACPLVHLSCFLPQNGMSFPLPLNPPQLQMMPVQKRRISICLL